MTKISDPHSGHQWYQHLSARTRTAALTATERMVYSALVNQTRYARPEPVPTGLDKRTVLSAAERLLAAGYLSDLGEPLPPPAGHPFVTVRTSGGWAESLGTFRVWSPDPSGPLTPGSAVLYGLLRSLAKGSGSLLGQTNLGVAKILNVDRQTVGRDLKRLVKAGLLTYHKGTRVRGTWMVAFNPQTPPGVFLPVAPTFTAADFAGGEEAVKGQTTSATVPASKVVVPKWDETTASPIFRQVMDEDPANRWLQTVWPQKMMDLWWPHFIDHMRGDHGPKWLAAIVAEAKRGHEKKGQCQTCAYLALHILANRIQTSGHGFEPLPVAFEEHHMETPDQRKEREQRARERLARERTAKREAEERQREESAALNARLLAERPPLEPLFKARPDDDIARMLRNL